jgi:hypothetical protein
MLTNLGQFDIVRTVLKGGKPGYGVCTGTAAIRAWATGNVSLQLACTRMRPWATPADSLQNL